MVTYGKWLITHCSGWVPRTNPQTQVFKPFAMPEPINGIGNQVSSSRPSSDHPQPNSRTDGLFLSC